MLLLFQTTRLLSSRMHKVSVEVWDGMWHNWAQATEGCGAGVLHEAVDALQRVGQFFRGDYTGQWNFTGGTAGGGGAPRSSLTPFQYHQAFHNIGVPPSQSRMQRCDDHDNIDMVTSA